MVADGVADAEHGWFECYEIQRPVAADIPAAEAVLLCTWREVLGGFGDFALAAGHDILVFGAGPVGLSFVKFARLLGLGWVGVGRSGRQQAAAAWHWEPTPSLPRTIRRWHNLWQRAASRSTP